MNAYIIILLGHKCTEPIILHFTVMCIFTYHREFLFTNCWNRIFVKNISSCCFINSDIFTFSGHQKFGHGSILPFHKKISRSITKIFLCFQFFKSFVLTACIEKVSLDFIIGTKGNG